MGDDGAHVVRRLAVRAFGARTGTAGCLFIRRTGWNKMD